MKLLGNCLFRTEKGCWFRTRIIANEELMKNMDAGVFNQIANVAALPGLQRYAFCMPDGTGDTDFLSAEWQHLILMRGIISPGGIGFDINCGMRLITTNLTIDEVSTKNKGIG